MAVSALALLVLSAGWWRSASQMDAACRRWGTLRAPEPESADSLGRMWSYTAREVRVDHQAGALRLVINKYVSFGPTREMVETWPRTWPAWDVSTMRIDSAPRAEWKFTSVLDWTMGRLGTTAGMRQGVKYRVFSTPYWALMLLVGVPGAVAAVRVRRRAARERAGACVACGYDMAGAAACPECGAGSAAAIAGGA